MLPFINIFGLKISMYGLLIVLGVAIGSAVAVFFPSQKEYLSKISFSLSVMLV